MGAFKGVTIIYVGGFQNDQILIKYLIWGSVHLLWGHLFKGMTIIYVGTFVKFFF